ncbi:MAG: mandelate racemase/muconate lactonizing enzyme family protein [Opitutales bacterium]|nr:mandelate racemase/muconate lactonizing enzyme family protein [Opitutales bacterium]
MKIKSIESIVRTAPYIRPHSPPGHPANGVRNCVWLRIVTDEGLVGWGEAYWGCYAPEATAAALRRFERSLVGKDPLDTETTLADLRFRNRYWAMRGLGAHCTSAVEAALWDIAGKAKDTPVWQLLGDGREHPVLLYASAGESALPPEAIRDEVGDYVRRGFRAYKIRCGGRLDDRGDRLAVDTERVAAAREALGPDRMLFVDVAVPQKSADWDFDKIVRYMEALSPYNVRFLEEPAMTYDVATYRRLLDLGMIPTAGGESFTCPEEFEPFFEAGAFGVAQPDAAVVGGPASCVEVIRRAGECGVPVAVHAWGGGVGLAQNLHAACALDGVLAMEFPLSTHALTTEPFAPLHRFKDGYLLPPDRPGLGVEVTDEFLAQYPFQPETERDF